MGNFYTDTITTDPRFNYSTRIADLSLLEPITRVAVQSILATAKTDLGLDLMVWETYRSQARQTALFAQKVTQLRTVGVHHYGLACDIVKVGTGGGPSWQGDFSWLGPLCVRFGLIWGGDWGEPDKPHTFRDYDHVQRCMVGDQDKLFAGVWYPDNSYLVPPPPGSGTIVT